MESISTENMKEKVKELLPIGSIIRLKDGIKSLIIIGVLQRNLENGDVYDYMTVPYPEGYINQEMIFYAMHKDIDEVIFEGYTNDEREEMFGEFLKQYKETE